MLTIEDKWVAKGYSAFKLEGPITGNTMPLECVNQQWTESSQRKVFVHSRISRKTEE